MASPELQQLVDRLVGLEEADIVTVVNSVLQARPEAATQVVAFAVPDLTYPPFKAIHERRGQGHIKSFNERNGFGFIECPEAKEIFGSDVFLHRAQLNGLQVGQQVSFAIMLSKEVKPQAFDVQPVSQTRGFSGMGNGSMSGGMQGMGGMSQSGGLNMSRMGRGTGMQGKGGGAGGFMGQNRDNRMGNNGAARVGSMGRDGSMVVKSVEVDESQILGTFEGTIKSFSHNTGYGFIASDDIKASWDCDAFLHKHQVGHFQPGAVVRFTAYLNENGKPQAKDLEDCTEDGAGGDMKRQRM